MIKIKRIAIHKILLLGGFHAFILTLGVLHPLSLITCALMTASLLTKFILKKNYLLLLLPLASGLLIFPMKLFYWDRADLMDRIENLLIMALLASLFMVIQRFKLVKKFTVFFNRLPLKKRLIYIFVFAEILFILASYVIVDKGVVLGGDEPHYLVISHSIARDMDLNVFNQYARDQYREFIDTRLTHHARVGKGFKKWYSYGHLPGLPLTTAPFFIGKVSPHPLLYFLIRAYLGLFGALTAILFYLFALRLWKHKTLALFITAVTTFTVPIFFFSIHVFAEIQAALLVLAALYLLLFAEKQTNFKILLAGFLLSISVFWGLKYNIFIYLFAAGFFVYFFFFKKERKKAFLLVLFPVFFQAVFFYYLYFAYGNFDLMSIYNGIMTEAQKLEYERNMQHIPMMKRLETLLGIFFDQRDGLLLYSPLYFFFFPGLILAFKKFKTYLPHLLVSAAGFGYILFMGYSTVRAGYCPQARYLAPAAWVLMLFAVIYRNETKNVLFKKLFYYIPIYSVAVMVYQVLNPFTLYQSATHTNLNRPGLMFQEWSSLHLNLPDILPSFVKVPGNFVYLPNVIFLVLMVVLIGLSLKKMKGRKLTFLPPVLFGVIFIFAALFPRVPVYNPILQTKGDAGPCKIYGESRYPTKTAERKFPLMGKREFMFTLSTVKAAPSLVLELENNEATSYEVTVSSFDREIKKETVPASGMHRIVIEKPKYKKFGSNCFYRVHLKLSDSAPTKPSLYFQVYPARSQDRRP